MAPPDISLADVANAVTPRTIACAVLLGSVVCLANVYFALQAGMVNSMPMHSALLGFAFFRSIQHHLSRPLSPSKTTLIEIIAGSLGLAPFMSGFTSFITALEFLATPEENGPTRFSFVQLLLWSIATCGLGIVTGAGSSLQETFSSARAASLSLCNCYWHTDWHFVWERRNCCPRKSVKGCCFTIRAIGAQPRS